MKVKLYHYTSEWHLPTIMKQGLLWGDVPTTPTGGENAVWFTESEKTANQRWCSGSSFNKQEVRITVELDTEDPLLLKWEDYAKMMEMEEEWYRILNATGGGEAHLWWIYRDVITPDKFLDVKYLT